MIEYEGTIVGRVGIRRTTFECAVHMTEKPNPYWYYCPAKVREDDEATMSYDSTHVTTAADKAENNQNERCEQITKQSTSSQNNFPTLLVRRSKIATRGQCATTVHNFAAMLSGSWLLDKCSSSIELVPFDCVYASNIRRNFAAERC